MVLLVSCVSLKVSQANDFCHCQIPNPTPAILCPCEHPVPITPPQDPPPGQVGIPGYYPYVPPVVPTPPPSNAGGSGSSGGSVTPPVVTPAPVPPSISYCAPGTTPTGLQVLTEIPNDHIILLKWESDAMNVEIRYGTKDGVWTNSAIVLNTGSTHIGGLTNHHSYFFQVRSLSSCENSSWSSSIDPKA